MYEHSNFSSRVLESGHPLTRNRATVLQLNLGKLCNMSCTHCHVGAGPTKFRENMNSETVARLKQLLECQNSICELDLTGGAPELNPHFRELVTFARDHGLKVIDRCNLTVLLENPSDELPEFLANNEVHIVASLPCYELENVETQRGSGVFEKNIQALKILNQLGYGQAGKNLKLTLVHNPIGPKLPGDQNLLTKRYREALHRDFDIQFTDLITITNMPINRFKAHLQRQNKSDDYQQLLEDNFNPNTIANLMCFHTISISWDGFIYDCDFNQMLNLHEGRKPLSIWEIASFDELTNRTIPTDTHCFGCTAGAGSSCQGSLG